MSALRMDALVAFGDNLSIDAGTVGPQNGAASLFYRNRDTAWPEFKGRDMVTRDPAVRLLLLAQDGATASSTLSQQTKRVPSVDDPVLVTITAGSRDVLALSESPHAQAPGVGDADALYDTLTALFDELGRRLSDAHILVANIPDVFGDSVPAAEALPEFNSVISDVAREQGASLVDLHTHFAGHGPEMEDEAWLTPNLDPTPQGASEIRRMFWQALLAL